MSEPTTPTGKRRKKADPGPYMDEAGTTWWFPTDAWTWNGAQSEASMFALDSDARPKYEGIDHAQLCPEDDWHFCEDPAHRRRAYRFSWVFKW